jgi:hypothetical protein
MEMVMLLTWGLVGINENASFRILKAITDPAYTPWKQPGKSYFEGKCLNRRDAEVEHTQQESAPARAFPTRSSRLMRQHFLKSRSGSLCMAGAKENRKTR